MNNFKNFINFINFITISCFAQYEGGNADGQHSISKLDIKICATPTRYYNVQQGGNADGQHSISKLDIKICATPTRYCDVQQGGNADGQHSISKLDIKICAPLTRYYNVQQGGNADGSYMSPSSCLVVLPIELLTFDATPVKDNNNKYYVRCNWSTATESNNDYFSIERSKEGKTFEQIGTRQGAGNSSTTLYYNFDDENPYTGLSYYRLKQTDYDGKYSYSKIVAVYIGEMDIINISPSPAENEIEYTIRITETTPVQIKVINVLGQEVINHTETIEKGLTQKKIDISMLASGLYMLSINTEQLGKTEKKFAIK